jgi:hypothetical protein
LVRSSLSVYRTSGTTWVALQTSMTSVDIIDNSVEIIGLAKQSNP